MAIRELDNQITEIPAAKGKHTPATPPNLRLKQALAMRRSYDLWILFGLALLLPGLVLLPVPFLRIPLGLVAVLLAPGYALVEATFPKRADLDGVARLGLSFGLSIAVLPLLALLLDNLPWGIRLWPMTISLALWILLVGAVAAWRRSRVSSAEAVFAPNFANPLRDWAKLSQRTKWLSLVAGLLVVGIVTWGVIILVSPNPADRLTEFYALGAQGQAQDYPREVAPDQPMQVTLGIVNREAITARYRIEVRAVTGDKLLAQAGSVTLADGQKWEQPIQYSLSQAGDNQEINILLFYNDSPTPYRQLHLWVNVQAKPALVVIYK